MRSVREERTQRSRQTAPASAASSERSDAAKTCAWFDEGGRHPGVHPTLSLLPRAAVVHRDPLKGLFSHATGGFYHDGRFPTLLDVVDHYDQTFHLGLTETQKGDLVEYLKSL